MKTWAGRVFWGLIWVFVLWYAAGSVLAHREAWGKEWRIQVLDRGDCQVMEEYLRRGGDRVRVESGTRIDTEEGVVVWLRLKLPNGLEEVCPLFFGPVDNAGTLAGNWPEEAGDRDQGSGARGEGQ